MAQNQHTAETFILAIERALPPGTELSEHLPVAKQEYSKAIDILRQRNDLQAIGEKLRCNMPNYIAGLGILLGLSTVFQKALMDFERKQNSAKGLPQNVAHRLVDLWGGLKASQVHLDQLLGYRFDPEDNGNVVSTKARLEGLGELVVENFLEIVRNIVPTGAFLNYAPLIDWGINLAKTVEQSGPKGAITACLEDIKA